MTACIAAITRQQDLTCRHISELVRSAGGHSNEFFLPLGDDGLEGARTLEELISLYEGAGWYVIK